MFHFFEVVLYQPLFNLLVYFYNIVPGNDIGLAIILLTILIKIILLPLSWQSLKGQKAMQDLQPKLEHLKKQYKNDKEKMTQEMMALYKENKVNPLSSCLPLLIQFPFLIAVYQVFRRGLNSESLELLYPFIQNPGHINTVFLNTIDLGNPSTFLAVLAGVAQYFQAKMLSTKKPMVQSKGSKDESIMASMNKNMLYVMPIITILIGMSLPGGLTLYWFLTTLLTVFLQLFMFKKQNENLQMSPAAQVVEGKAEEIKQTAEKAGEAAKEKVEQVTQEIKDQIDKPKQ